MSIAAMSSLVRYRITPTEQGIRLEIWELPPTGKSAKVPFLFRLRYHFPTLSMAESALNCHLFNNDVVSHDLNPGSSPGINNDARLESKVTAEPESWVFRKLLSVFNTYQ